MFKRHPIGDEIKLDDNGKSLSMFTDLLYTSDTYGKQANIDIISSVRTTRTFFTRFNLRISFKLFSTSMTFNERSLKKQILVKV